MSGLAPRIPLPLRWFGGKGYLAKTIVEMMPSHTSYVEPFAGGLAVLMAKPPRGNEIVNDLYGDLTNFWRVLQHPVRFEEFQRIVQAMPLSEQEYRDAASGTETVYDDGGYVGRAVRFFVHCRQSFSGNMDSFIGIDKRTCGNKNKGVDGWLNSIEGLPLVHERLRRVMILNRDAFDLIKSFDRGDTVIYLDPPYVPATRETKDRYKHEFSTTQHIELCTLIRDMKAKILLSGYPSMWYEKLLERYGWKRTDIDIANHAAGGTSTKRRMTECIWRNFA